MSFGEDIPEAIAHGLLDFFIWEIALETHRALKKRLECHCPPEDPRMNHVHHGMVRKEGYDIFGQKLVKASSPVVKCPLCHTNKQAVKFAAHLEKCLGLGGRDSRRTTQRNRRHVAHQQTSHGGSQEAMTLGSESSTTFSVSSAADRRRRIGTKGISDGNHKRARKSGAMPS
eukprot:gene10466-2596_t